jgi:hypothetical protein
MNMHQWQTLKRWAKKQGTLTPLGKKLIKLTLALGLCFAVFWAGVVLNFFIAQDKADQAIIDALARDDAILVDYCHPGGKKAKGGHAKGSRQP